jgi:hypothetical protein
MYLWQNDFNHNERTTLATILGRVLIEYCIFFVVLFNHHTIAMTIFHSKSWYPATCYFDLLFSAILSLTFLLFRLILRYNLIFAPTNLLDRSVYYIQTMYIMFLAFGLYFLRHYYYFRIHVLSIFIGISLLFVIGYAYDKCLTVSNLIKIVNTKPRYSIFVQGYCLALSGGLILASFFNKIALIANHHRLSPMLSIATPLLCLSLCSDYFMTKSIKHGYRLTKFEMHVIYLNLHRVKGELIARMGINLIISVFLVKWYFILPLFLQYSERWHKEQIADIILLASCLSFMVNWLLMRCFRHINIRSLFVTILMVFCVALIFVATNLYRHHWVGGSVIIMAIFYNSIQSVINRIIHHELIKIEINLILLIVGSAVSLILFSFMVSCLSVFMAKQIGIHSQTILTTSLMLVAIAIGLVSFSRLSSNEE